MIPLIIGTRGSALAQAQTRLVRDALKKAWPTRTFETHIIKTEGDRLSEQPAVAAEKLEKGLFTAELERALLGKKIHLAVHSLKDLPTESTDGLVIAAVPVRADPRDVLITRGARTLAELPHQARIATGSPRRSAQLLLARPDFRIVAIRGNIDTRLRKFRETADWSALILAAAGLERLLPDLAGLAVTPLPLEIMLPAPGQGALALQTRYDDKEMSGLLRALHDPATSAAVTAERMFLQALGGGCEEPVGAYAQVREDGLLHLDGVAWLFGEKKERRGALRRTIGEAERLGVDLAVEISR
jgi:hydroxymethylbilane synthase